MGLFTRSAIIPAASQALPGRASRPFTIDSKHAVLGNAVEPPFPAELEVAVFGMGCFWGAERKFWQTPGVWSTSAGYAGGHTPNPTYEEVCSGATGHAEVVQVVFDPTAVSYGDLLKVFWESHDPTQGMQQGNDRGTQYRSVIYTSCDAHLEAALESKTAYEQMLRAAGYHEVTTEVEPLNHAGPFYYAEDYHQQYLHKVPNGYCGLAGTGVTCPAPPATVGETRAS